jgi:pseudouridylate synthase / pseudouridine kinase
MGMGRHNTSFMSASSSVSHPGPPQTSVASTENPTPLPHNNRYDVLVAGALAADLSCDYAPLEGFADSATPLLHTSNPAVFSQSVGGVGHNIALAAHYAGASTLLCSAVGDDITGRALIKEVQNSGLPTSGIQVLDAATGVRTAQYVALNDNKKDLVIAMADMSIMSCRILDSKSVWQSIMTRHQPTWVVIDGNWSQSTLSHITVAAKSVGARIAYEPVSAQKSSRLIKLMTPADVVPNHHAEIATPNMLELQAMYHKAQDASLFESESWWSVISALNLPRGGSREHFIRLTNSQLVDEGVPQQSLQLLPYIPCIVTKLGVQGCLISQLLRPGDPRLQDPDSAPYILGRAEEDDGAVGGVYMRLFPPAELVKQEDVVSVNGVGDTLLGVLVAAMSAKGAEARVEDVLVVAQEAAVMSLKSDRSVSEEVRSILAR